MTIREDDWAVPADLPNGVVHLKGQLESGAGGFRHWQVMVSFGGQQRRPAVQQLFGGTAHCEPSRSDAVAAYVWKEDTRVPGTQFELGRPPIKLNTKPDWDAVWLAAKEGRVDDIPAGIRVRCYANLRRIRADHAVALPVLRTVRVFVGPTGTGKSHRAWGEAGMDAYPKDPRTKFWDGYQHQHHVVIDEFRGGIDIAHLLRWLDRYPVLVEIKGSSVPLVATNIWITSNIAPNRWYPDLDPETYAALERRLNVEIMDVPYVINIE